MVWFARPTASSMLIGGLVVILGEVIRLWGVSIAGSETRTTGPVGGTQLVTTGPFGYVRNPLYVGNMLIYTGVGVMSMALFPWLALGALAFFFGQYTAIVSLEEEHLRQKFGEEYDRYTGAVPRFFPLPKKYVGEQRTQPKLEWQRGIISEKSTLLAIVCVTALLIVMLMFRG